MWIHFNVQVHFHLAEYVFIMDTFSFSTSISIHAYFYGYISIWTGYMSMCEYISTQWRVHFCMETIPLDTFQFVDIVFSLEGVFKKNYGHISI